MYPKSAPTWRCPAGLLVAYVVIWLALAVDPVFRDDWLLENAIVLVAVPLLVATAPRLRFSNLAYIFLFVFFVLHAVGAHYTYSLVPYADWWQALGGAPPAGRNHYDRIVHALYGFLVTPAAVELFAHYASSAWPTSGRRATSGTVRKTWRSPSRARRRCSRPSRRPAGCRRGDERAPSA